MSGPDYRQQQELEEFELFEFVSGQSAARARYPIPEGSSSAFVRGYKAQKDLKDVSNELDDRKAKAIKQAS